jgi:hypothetical protein
MGNKILVIGDSGQGKSTSCRTLDPASTFYINVIGKPLPFAQWKKLYTRYEPNKGGNLLVSHDAEQVCNAIKHINAKMPHIKVIVIDDAQYVMSYEFMERSLEKGFEKFTEIGKHMFDVLVAPDATRDDLTTVFLSHSEDVNANGFVKTKMKTIGKMLDDKITVEGLFSVVLVSYAYKKQDKSMEYCFVTQSNGTTTAKSPMGMFKDITIPNDMNFVLTEMNKYYGGE